MPSSTCISRFLTFVFCLFSGFVFSQNITFQKKIGGPGFSSDNTYAVLETADGYLIAGRTIVPGNVKFEATLLYTDKNGAIIWQKRYGGEYHMEFYAVAAANDGGFIVWGSTVNTIQGFSDGWLMKVDVNGNLLWQKIVGVTDFSESPTGKIVVMPDGYILSGVKFRSGGSQSFVLRTDNDGNTLWSWLTPFDDYSRLHASYLADGLLYLTGTINNQVCWRTMDPATGAIVQSQEYEVGLINRSDQMHRTPEGDHLMTGTVRLDVPGLIHFKGWVQKVNSAGEIIWSKTYQFLYRNSLFASAIFPDGSSVIALIYTPLPNGNTNRMGLVRLDTDGAVVWARSYGSDEFLLLNQIVQTSDGGIMAVGYTSGPGGPSDTEMFVLKTDSLGGLDGCCIADISVTVEDVMPSLHGAFFDATISENTEPFEQAFEDIADLHSYDFCSNAQPQINQTIQFCPGETVTIAGTIYDQPGTVTALIPSTTGDCDTLATYTLELLTNPMFQQTIQFCPGETVTIAGTTYDQPGTVTVLIASTTGGCDTIATYTLEFSTTGQTSALDLMCPGNIEVIVPVGTNGLSVSYDQPVVASDCICPGTLLELSAGNPSGSVFPVGTSTVCYRATDVCGALKTCCFQVKVQEESTCDVKTAGCLKFEILQINRDVNNNWVYRIRVTNNCSAGVQYVYLQVPNGLQAIEPAANSSYLAPSGASYIVRNPNFSPFYGLRFKSETLSLANGQSDVFRYVLPAQADVTHIHAAVRLTSGVYSEVHLNTFSCPVGAESAAAVAFRSEFPHLAVALKSELSLSPNPVSANTYVQIQGGYFSAAVLVLQDMLGRTVLECPVTDNQLLLENTGIIPGLYLFHILENGQIAGSGKVVVGK